MLVIDSSPIPEPAKQTVVSTGLLFALALRPFGLSNILFSSPPTPDLLTGVATHPAFLYQLVSSRFTFSTSFARHMLSLPLLIPRLACAGIPQVDNAVLLFLFCLFASLITYFL